MPREKETKGDGELYLFQFEMIHILITLLPAFARTGSGPSHQGKGDSFPLDGGRLELALTKVGDGGG